VAPSSQSEMRSDKKTGYREKYDWQ
jgi:hypothetical protein